MRFITARAKYGAQSWDYRYCQCKEGEYVRAWMGFRRRRLRSWLLKRYFSCADRERRSLKCSGMLIVAIHIKACWVYRWVVGLWSFWSWPGFWDITFYLNLGFYMNTVARLNLCTASRYPREELRISHAPSNRNQRFLKWARTQVSRTTTGFSSPANE